MVAEWLRLGFERLGVQLPLAPGCVHYENRPMRNTEIFIGIKNENFHQKNLIFFLFWLKT